MPVAEKVVTSAEAPTPSEDEAANGQIVGGTSQQEEPEPDESDDSPAAKRIRQTISQNKELQAKLTASERNALEANEKLAALLPFAPIVDQIKRGGHQDADAFAKFVSDNNLSQIQDQVKTAMANAAQAYHAQVAANPDDEAAARREYGLAVKEIELRGREAEIAEKERYRIMLQEQQESRGIDSRVADALKEYPDASARILKRLLTADPKIDIKAEAKELHEEAQKRNGTYQERKEKQKQEGAPEGKGGGNTGGSSIETAPDALKDPKGFSAWYAKHFGKK